MSMDRSVAILRMKQAFKEGLSFNRFHVDMKAAGLKIRRQTLLSDWRNENQLEIKKDALKYVRKDYYPSKAAYAAVTYKMSAEFMYNVRVRSRVRPTEPITDRFVNIMQDKPLTPGEIEALAWSLIGEQSPKRIGEVVSVTAFRAIRRTV